MLKNKVYVTWAIQASLLPPFYPREAEARGATPSEYGFVFGICDMAAFLTAPLFGRYGERIGPTFLFCFGSFFVGLTSVAFGFLAFTEDLIIFLGFSYLLRFIGGIAEAAAWGSILSILISIFPGKESLVFGGSEMVSGFGAVIGPAVGSLLYNLGGFILPFLIIGMLIMFSSIGTILLIQKANQEEDEETDKKSAQGKRLTFTELSKHLSMILPFVDNFVCVFTTAMVKGMIEPYFRNVTDAIHYDVIHTNDANHYDIVHENELNNYAVKNIEIYNYDTSKNEVLAKETFINNILANNSSSNSAFQSSSSQNEVAVLFCIQGAIYMMTNLFIGVIASRIQHPALVSLLGNILLTLALILLAPSPFIPLEPSKSLIEGSLGLIGFCSALLMVASFLRAHRAAIHRGFQDDMKTYIFISGMWSSSYFLGSFLGPTVGGVMVEHVGFPWTTSAYSGLVFLMAICDGFELVDSSRYKKYTLVK